MKKSNKLMATTISILLAASMMGGCTSNTDNVASKESTSKDNQTTSTNTTETSNFNETGFPITNEKTTQTVMLRYDPSFTADDISQMYYLKEMEKKTNVSLKVEKLTADQWTERLSLTFASNELPDILMGPISNNDIITYSKAKQLLPLNDVLTSYSKDYMTFLNKFAEKGKMYAPDGNMYGIASFTGGAEVPGARPFINVKWLKNLGLKMPETYDDFYDVLVAFRDKDPDGNGKNDTIPLSGYVSGYPVDPFVAGPLGISYGWCAKDNWQVVGDKLVFVAEHPNYKKYLENMNKLYTEKLLDQEYYTQNDAQMKAKGTNLLVGVYDYAAHFVFVNSTDPAIYEQYEILPPLISDVFTKKTSYGQAVDGPVIFFTSANKKPEISARYFNELYTDAGAELLVGPVNGEWDGEGGRVWNADKTTYTYVVPEKYTGIFNWLNSEIAPLASGFWGNAKFSKIKGQEEMAPEDAHFTYQMMDRLTPYMVSDSPSLFFTPEELDEIKLVEASIYTYASQMEAKIIMGVEPIGTYDAMITELKNQGLDTATKIKNQAYSRYLAGGK